MEDKKYCVYRHIRLDTNKVFYIGIGNEKRPYIKKDRNEYWFSIINKTEYEIQILTKNLLLKDAFDLEIDLISYYGRINNKTGILCNMTDGGPGGKNIVVSKKTRKLKSDLQKANPTKYWKGKTLSTKHVEKMINNSGMAKKVINTKTGEIYSSCRQCALINKFCYPSFIQKLNGIRKNTTIFKFIENGK